MKVKLVRLPDNSHQIKMNNMPVRSIRTRMFAKVCQRFLSEPSSRSACWLCLILIVLQSFWFDRDSGRHSFGSEADATDNPARLHVDDPADQQDQASLAQRLAEVIKQVETKFYRDPLAIPEYQMAKAQAIREIETCGSLSDFRRIVDRLLNSLASSHTYYLTPDDWEYYHLAAVFAPLPEIKTLFKDQPITVPSIGVIVRRLDNRWLVADVLPGGAAAAGGVQIGDVLLRVAFLAYSPVSTLRPHVGHATPFTVLRAGQEIQLHLTPQLVQPEAELLEAVQSSVSVSEYAGRRIGYIHFYSYAGRQYHEVLEEAIAYGELKEAEALVIDLRYGLGGANANYLNLFNPLVPKLTMLDRDGQAEEIDSQWRKPVVLLINETTRSGKEVLAFGAKKHGLATLVGTTTAGAVLAGSPIIIGQQDILYLAVRDILVDDQRLEGRGVVPDIEVPLDLLTCQGVDHQKNAAFEQAAKLLENLPPVR